MRAALITMLWLAVAAALGCLCGFCLPWWLLALQTFALVIFLALLSFPLLQFKPRVVYDKLHPTADAVAGALTFESRFESGNLQRAIQVRTPQQSVVRYYHRLRGGGY